LPAPVFDRAEHLAERLLATTRTAVLLHGDLHHANILSGTRAPWLAIDPKGVVGDPGAEVGPFLRNPRPISARALSRRLDILADELAYDRPRLRDWGIAHAVLSACWSLEDHGSGWHTAIATAEALMRLA
jgi:streptomycin 6-kinase